MQIKTCYSLDDNCVDLLNLLVKELKRKKSQVVEFAIIDYYEKWRKRNEKSIIND